eukprot:TRINITY_DN6882_c0_g2_i1.p1 TRINITY_DN6882_c0_g2~~TRINITY_DN6882_c0_g2_i1.p1  ORF type:complete len:322 (+),score=62.29 TRINITY_DN6882_c0_g2_i1:61-1026(+)
MNHAQANDHDAVYLSSACFGVPIDAEGAEGGEGVSLIFHDGRDLMRYRASNHLPSLRVKALTMRYCNIPAILGYEICYESAIGETFVHRRYPQSTYTIEGVVIKHKTIRLEKNEFVRDIGIQFSTKGVNFLQLITSEGRQQSFGYLYRKEGDGQGKKFTVPQDNLFCGFCGTLGEYALMQIGLVLSKKQTQALTPDSTFQPRIIINKDGAIRQQESVLALSPQLLAVSAPVSVDHHASESSQKISPLPDLLVGCKTSRMNELVQHHNQHNPVLVTGEGTHPLFTRKELIIVGTVLLSLILSFLGVITFIFVRTSGDTKKSW